ncbi:MAG: PTS fructose transporter subunit IIA [Gammaproteobacteria bacterium]|nr:PTS fructose transporter subunit IIA [Gammaproteobacteria bacterium]MCB1925214.1 PTS fructose transporter subunit IIA [Gammaproteobacteria bacterium]
MSVGVLLITHPGVGSSLLHIAMRIIGHSTLAVKCLEVPPDAAVDPVLERARSMLKVLDHGAGVLVLTDLFGATPHNVAQAVACGDGRTNVLAGLNLPMLVRVFNYPGDDLDTLTSKAAEGGSRGIIACPFDDAQRLQGKG